MRKTRDVVVTGSQPVGSRATNDLQSRSHNNARTQESVKNTQTSNRENRTCKTYLKRLKDVGRTIGHTKISFSRSYISRPAFFFKSWKELTYGALERLAILYLRGRQFNRVYITSSHQKESVNYQKSFLCWCKKEIWIVRALKLLASNIYNGKLPLDDKILSLLRQKHLASIKLNEEVLLKGEKPSVHSAVFEDIYLSMVKEAA